MCQGSEEIEVIAIDLSKSILRTTIVLNLHGNFASNFLSYLWDYCSFEVTPLNLYVTNGTGVVAMEAPYLCAPFRLFVLHLFIAEI